MNIVLPVCLYLDDNKEVNTRMREELGKRLHKTEYDYTDYLKCLAKSGDVQSQYLLGLSYARGFGCIKNYCRAMKWWTKAAAQGHKSSQYLLGSSYYFDYEVYRNYKKAAYWLEKAAIQDDDWAKLLLGDCYYLGRGVAKNYKTADDILVSDKHGLKPYFFSSFLQEKVHFQALF